MAKAAKSAKKRALKEPSTTAFHGKAQDGRDMVSIDNLRVVIVQDGDAWFAQGLEIDYAVQGSSIANVKAKFERGLLATIHENLRAFGNIERILRVAPADVQNELLYSPGMKLKEYSCESLHSISESLTEEGQQPLPFGQIVFVESHPAA